MGEYRYFDYRQAASEAGIAPDQLLEIERLFRMDYPADDMLYELHVLRACMAVRDRMASLDAILREARNPRADAA